MSIKELITRPQSNEVTAEQVFNFAKGQELPNRDRPFSAKFSTDNHILEAVTEIVPFLDVQAKSELRDFINNMIQYPHVQIPTITNIGQEKVRLPLDQMIELHSQEIERIKDEQQELAYYEGDSARTYSLFLISRSIGLNGIRIANEASISLPGNKYNPKVLIPLFNIYTAARLSTLASVGLPYELLDLETSSFELPPPSDTDTIERYF